MKVKIDQADKLFSQYIRLRDRQCKRCGSHVIFNDKGLPVSHQASHFVGRGKESTRFDPDNVDCLCGGCHLHFTANPLEHYDWQVRTKGQKVVDEIRLRSSLYCKKDRKMQAFIWKQALKDIL